MQIFSTNSLFVGKVAVYLEKIDSTNAYAKTLLSKSKPIAGTVIYTDKQLAGRGQIGSKWISSPNESLILSVILYPRFLSASHQFQLNKAISLAVLDLLQPKVVQKKITIKWPNDIYVGNKKMGGILIENSLKGNFIESTVVGIGLNINQEEFPTNLPNPTSLFLSANQKYNITKLIGQLCERIEQRYLQLKSKSKKLDNDYLTNLLGKDEWRNFYLPIADTTIAAKIIGVSSLGKLKLATAAHPLTFDLKEIKFLFS